MRLIDPAIAREHLGLPPDPAEDDLIRQRRAGPGDWCDAALRWAEAEYPEASNLDRCSFAGLLAYYVTGWYGGYGTESYDREEHVQSLILLFAGGHGLPGDTVVYTPPVDERGELRLPADTGAFSRAALDVLEQAYFRTGGLAGAHALADRYRQRWLRTAADGAER